MQCELKTKGRLILKEIEFNRVFKKKVMRSDKVGKIYLPRELIGKDVYVVVDKKGWYEKNK